MLGIVGTIPDPEFPLSHGLVRMQGDRLLLNGRSIPIQRGTAALIASALAASTCFGNPEVYAFLAGDIGKGEGSRNLYRFLSDHLRDFDFNLLTFHYILPDVDWHGKVLLAIEALPKRPFLIADAGFMYAAKMSGLASSYDFFTPDIGELAFLADELVPHPFYTRGFILHQEDRAEELIERACLHENAARHMVVKGAVDRIVAGNRIVATVDSPSREAMEAIGGTGDTLTGMLSLLCHEGLAPVAAGKLAALANRVAGCLAGVDPATQVSALIDTIPRALSHAIEMGADGEDA